NDTLLCTISESNPNLRELYLEFPQDITNKGVRKIVSGCSKLRYINLLDCPDFSDYEYVESRGIRLDKDEPVRDPSGLLYSDDGEEEEEEEEEEEDDY
ncbi:hypothetical protein H4S08_003767, partial [Coemansia sp. RSA 1365]